MSECPCGKEDCPGAENCVCGDTCGCYVNLKGDKVMDGDLVTPKLVQDINLVSVDIVYDSPWPMNTDGTH